MSDRPSHYERGPWCFRRYRPEDAAALEEAVLSSWEHLYPRMIWVDGYKSLGHAAQSIDRINQMWTDDADFTLGMWHEEEFIGGTGFHMRWHHVSPGVGEIGMWIRANRAGQGLGTLALHEMLLWGFGPWQWRKLHWVADIDNLGSQRVAEKNGMRREAEIRSLLKLRDGTYNDAVVFGMLAEEFSLAMIGTEQ